MMIIEIDRSMLERAHVRIAREAEERAVLRGMLSLWRCFAIIEGAALAGIILGIARGWL